MLKGEYRARKRFKYISTQNNWNFKERVYIGKKGGGLKANFFQGINRVAGGWRQRKNN